MNMKLVEIYTDGACSGNPGMGGWAAILMYGSKSKEITGFEEYTTNNRMELTAAIAALKHLNFPCKVLLYSDSAYLVNSLTNGWIIKWKENNWKKSGEPIKNVDLWQELDRLNKIHQITWIKVAGHSDNKLNNRCDELATGEIKKRKKKHKHD